MADKHTITLEIAGAKYRMTSDAGADHLRRLADIVSERVDKIGPKGARSPSAAQKLAVVALGLADDLVTAEQRAGRLEEATRAAIGAALERIDDRLKAHAQGNDNGGS